MAKKNLTSKFRKAASTSSGRVHVVPSKSGWSVKKEGAKRSVAVRPTKEHALKVAGKIKASGNVTVVVHKKDGTIQRTKGKK